MIPELHSKARQVGQQRRTGKAALQQSIEVNESSLVGAGPLENEYTFIDWRSQVIAVLQSMHPNNFEKLCQRVLHESGLT